MRHMLFFVLLVGSPVFGEVLRYEVGPRIGSGRIESRVEARSLVPDRGVLRQQFGLEGEIDVGDRAKNGFSFPTPRSPTEFDGLVCSSKSSF